jgi:hypothetical protein
MPATLVGRDVEPRAGILVLSLLGKRLGRGCAAGVNGCKTRCNRLLDVMIMRGIYIMSSVFKSATYISMLVPRRT